MSSAAALDPSLLLSDPHWFADDLDLENRVLRFVRVDRALLSDTPFLDERMDRTGRATAALPLDDATGTSGPAPRLHFIWHTAFCLSTLIAHALDMPGENLSLREPRILMNLGRAKRTRWAAQNGLERALPDATFRLLARRFAPAEQILIKPTNTVNTLMHDAASLTDGRMLFLYSDCRSFLISIAKKRQEGYVFARKLFAILAADGHPFGRLAPRQLLEMSDLQIAALVWHMQIAEMRNAMAMLGQRAASLNCDDFLANPKGALAALDGFFDLDLGAARIDAVAASDLLKRDAKNTDAAYDGARRASEAGDTAKMLGTDLPRVIEWSYGAAPETPKGAPLPQPLVIA